MLEKWTKTSPPSGREIKPYPFSLLKNLTVPVGIATFLCCAGEGSGVVRTRSRRELNATPAAPTNALSGYREGYGEALPPRTFWPPPRAPHRPDGPSHLAGDHPPSLRSEGRAGRDRGASRTRSRRRPHRRVARW